MASPARGVCGVTRTKGQEDMQARASGLEGTCKRGAEPSPLVTEGETEAEGAEEWVSGLPAGKRWSGDSTSFQNSQTIK